MSLEVLHLIVLAYLEFLLNFNCATFIVNGSSMKKFLSLILHFLVTDRELATK